MKVLVLLTMMVTIASTSFASSFLTATINRATTTDGDTALMLTYVSGGDNGSPICSGFPNRSWFFPATENMDSEALAIALTAVSLQKNIRISVEECPVEGGTGVFSQVGIDN